MNNFQIADLPPLERVMRKVRIDASGCWLWCGARSTRGYGNIRIAIMGGLWKVHRLVWALLRGPIPDGMEVCHECDNPPCCNPEHLFLGTHLDNCRDRDAKGRNVNHRGSQHGRALLTEQDVRDIRASKTHRRWLRRQYGISRGAMDGILSGRTWKHVL